MVGEVIADRSNILRVTNVGAGLTQAASAALVLQGTAPLWHLIALAVVNGALSAASLPAMASDVPSLMPRTQLQQANELCRCRGPWARLSARSG